jgi:hypothetical protein
MGWIILKESVFAIEFCLCPCYGIWGMQHLRPLKIEALISHIYFAWNSLFPEISIIGNTAEIYE